ncbi:MAG: glycine zipper domain-containing protein [Verrucomicrobiota bacterium]
MKHILLITSAVAATAFFTNCTAPAGPSTQSGAVSGALLGGLAGGVIGHQSGRTTEGALLGAAAGGTAGAVIGNQQDSRRYHHRH